MFRTSLSAVVLALCIACEPEPYTVPTEGHWVAPDVRCDDPAFDGGYGYTVHPKSEGATSHAAQLSPLWALERTCTLVGTRAPEEAYVLDQTFSASCDATEYELELELAFDRIVATADGTVDIYEDGALVSTCSGVFFHESNNPYPVAVRNP